MTLDDEGRSSGGRPAEQRGGSPSSWCSSLSFAGVGIGPGVDPKLPAVASLAH
jgi:hypothetical protein